MLTRMHACMFMFFQFSGDAMSIVWEVDEKDASSPATLADACARAALCSLELHKVYIITF